LKYLRFGALNMKYSVSHLFIMNLKVHQIPTLLKTRTLNRLTSWQQSSKSFGTNFNPTQRNVFECSKVNKILYTKTAPNTISVIWAMIQVHR
jgi:hypothetical protein